MAVGRMLLKSLITRGSRHIVLAVDGARFAAVQVASLASKGDQVPQFYRSLNGSRLCLKYSYASSPW
jgi:hypothetical protein